MTESTSTFMDQFNFATAGETVDVPVGPVFAASEPQRPGPYDEADPSFIKAPRKPRNAAVYERKAGSILDIAFRFTAPRDSTVADAAALMQYGAPLAEKVGILAAHDARVAKFLDYITEGTENPYIAVGVAALPLVTQIIRNHEPVLEPAPRGIRIPFTKDKATGESKRIRIPFRVGVRLGMIRNATHDPRTFTAQVFSQANVKEQMDKQGIDVAFYRR